MVRLDILPTVLVLLIVVSHSVYAQRERDTFTTVNPIDVVGHVRIADLGEPARNVSVRLERFSGGIIDQMATDHQGRFRFGGLGRGYYSVIVEAPGFRVSKQTADLQIAFRAFLVFELERDTNAKTGPAIVDARVPAAAREEYARALAAMQQKKVKQALPHLEKAVSIHPEFFDANLMLGIVFMDLRQWKEAKIPLTRALDFKPDSPAAMISLGEVNWRLKRYADAENLLVRGLDLDNANWHAYFTLARLHWDQGDVMKTGAAVGRTLQLKPDFAEARLLAGNVFLRVGEKRRAIVEYEEYLKLAPKGEFVPQTAELVRELKKTVAETKP